MTETPERPELTEVARRIVAAISQGMDDNRDESDRESIAKRYRELRISLGSFADAAFQSRVEFVQSVISSASPLSAAEVGKAWSDVALVFAAANWLIGAQGFARNAGISDAIELHDALVDVGHRMESRLSASAPSPEDKGSDK